jgi:hypothetical protein
MTDNLLDTLADLETDVRDSRTLADFNAAQKYDTTAIHWEACSECGGTGRWHGIRTCFKCKGQGKKSFKTSADERQRAQVQRQMKKEDSEAAKAESFNAANPAIAAWIAANPGFEFARSLGQAVRKYGDLTENQKAAVERSIAKTQQKVAAAQERVSNAVECDVSRIEQAFTTALSKGYKKPRLNLGEFQFSRAPDHGRNPGAVYVKQGEDYLGKVQTGKFIASAVCGDDRQSAVVLCASNPFEAAKAYGRRTGTCCCCGRTLTAHASIEAGIGPICASKHGW